MTQLKIVIELGDTSPQLLHFSESGSENISEKLCCILSVLEEMRNLIMPLSPNLQKLVDSTVNLNTAITTFLANQGGATAAAVQAAIDNEDTDPAVVAALKSLQDDIAILTPAVATATAAVKPVQAGG